MIEIMLGHGAAAARGGREERGALQTEQSDLLELWRRVFDGARPSTATQAAPEAFGELPSERDPADGEARMLLHTPTKERLNDAFDVDASMRSQHSSASGLRSSAEGSASSAGEPGIEPAATRAAALSAGMAQKNGPVLLRRTQVEDQSGLAVTRPVRDIPEELPALESVRVFHDEAGLKVVVRHAALSAQTAVQCALETALHLAGDRRALNKVTLNGHAVYEARTPSRSAKGSASIVFRC